MIERYVWRSGQWINRATGEAMPKGNGKVCAPIVQSDTPAYFSVASMKMVDGRRARREDLKRTGSRETDPGEGPKTCRTEKWAKRLKLDHDPNGGRPKHWGAPDDNPAPIVRGPVNG